MSNQNLVDHLTISSSSFAQYVAISISDPHCHLPSLVWGFEPPNQEPQYVFTNGCTYCLVGNGDCEVTDDPPPHPEDRCEAE